MGEFFSVACSLCWSTSILFLKTSGNAFPPFSLNLIKNTFAAVLFAFTLPIVGWQHTTDPHHIIGLILSGIIGIGFADTLFLAGLNRIGAMRTAIVECLYSPFVIVLASLGLGERLTVINICGGSLIIAAVILIGTTSQRAKVPVKEVKKGIFFVGLSVFLMAIGIVIMKPILAHCSLIWATEVRILAGIATMFAMSPFFEIDRNTWRSVFLPQHRWTFFWGAFLSTYVAMILWVAGMKYTAASRSALLNQTSTIFTIFLAAIFLRERLDRYKIISTVLAFLGACLVLI